MDINRLSPAQQHGLELLLREVFRYVDFETKDDGHNTSLEVRWDGPPVIRIAVQSDRPVIIRDAEPPSVSMDEWIRNTLPGLWGYIPERQRADRICLWCSKPKSDVLPAKMTRRAPA